MKNPYGRRRIRTVCNGCIETIYAERFGHESARCAYCSCHTDGTSTISEAITEGKKERNLSQKAGVKNYHEWVSIQTENNTKPLRYPLGYQKKEAQ